MPRFLGCMSKDTRYNLYLHAAQAIAAERDKRTGHRTQSSKYHNRGKLSHKRLTAVGQGRLPEKVKSKPDLKN